MTTDLEKLHQLTELAYAKSAAGLTDILAKEAALRADLKRLRDAAFEAQSLPVAARSMRNIGADVIWLQWVAKTTGELNLELAQVLAQKEALLARQRRALGRRDVADGLVADARKDAAAKRKKAALEAAIEFDLMRRSSDQ